MSLRRKILTLLRHNPKGMSAFALVKALFPPNVLKTTHKFYVSAFAKVDTELMTLNHQQLVQSKDGLWTLTEKGHNEEKPIGFTVSDVD